MTEPADARPRALTAPVAALHALRDAVLAAPDGELRLRDAGYVAGLAMYDDFAAEAHAGAPEGLPLAEFVRALAAYLDASGWGAVEIDARAGAAAVRVASADWAESEPGAGSAHPACHFSTGVLAGLFGRASGRTLAVLEVACRSAGAERCEFTIGSRATLDAIWTRLRD